MFTGEVLRQNLQPNKISAIDSEHRLIRASDAVIRYADRLILENIQGLELLTERNRMHHSRKFSPSGNVRWESAAILRIICPSNTVIVTSTRFLEPESLIEHRTAEAKSKKMAQPVGLHVVKFQCETEGVSEDVVEAERVLNIAFAPHTGPLDEFSLRVFKGAEIDYSGPVNEESADDVLTMLEMRFDSMLTAV